MTTAKDTGPLDWRIAIVDQTGRPTPEFQRRWSTQRDNNAKIGVLSFLQLTDVPVSYLGFGNDILRVKSTEDGIEFVTTAASLDTIGATQGSILYRNATTWVTLGPGLDGYVLTTHGAGANPTWVKPQGANGFGFFCQGLLSANVQVGAAIYGFGISFDDTNTDNIFVSAVPATASAVFNLVAPDIHGLPSVVGTITFAAGSKTGTLAWTTNPYTLPARTSLQLFTPATADATLADISGLCFGSKI